MGRGRLARRELGMGSGSDSEQSRWCALTRVSFVTNKKGKAVEIRKWIKLFPS